MNKFYLRGIYLILSSILCQSLYGKPGDLYKSYLASITSDLHNGGSSVQFNTKWAETFSDALARGSLDASETTQIMMELCALETSLQNFEKAIAINDELIKLYSEDDDEWLNLLINGSEIAMDKFTISQNAQDIPQALERAKIVFDKIKNSNNLSVNKTNFLVKYYNLLSGSNNNQLCGELIDYIIPALARQSNDIGSFQADTLLYFRRIKSYNLALKNRWEEMQLLLSSITYNNFSESDVDLIANICRIRADSDISATVELVKFFSTKYANSPEYRRLNYRVASDLYRRREYSITVELITEILGHEPYVIPADGKCYPELESVFYVMSDSLMQLKQYEKAEIFKSLLTDKFPDSNLIKILK